MVESKRYKAINELRAESTTTTYRGICIEHDPNIVNPNRRFYAVFEDGRTIHADKPEKILNAIDADRSKTRTLDKFKALVFSGRSTLQKVNVNSIAKDLDGVNISTMPSMGITERRKIEKSVLTRNMRFVQDTRGLFCNTEENLEKLEQAARLIRKANRLEYEANVILRAAERLDWSDIIRRRKDKT